MTGSLNKILASDVNLTVIQRGELQMVSLALSLFGQQIMPKLLIQDQKLEGLFNSLADLLQEFESVLQKIESF